MFLLIVCTVSVELPEPIIDVWAPPSGIVQPLLAEPVAAQVPWAARPRVLIEIAAEDRAGSEIMSPAKVVVALPLETGPALPDAPAWASMGFV